MEYIDKEHKFIIENKKNYEKTGIYFLIKNNEIIYIGKTIELVRRLGNHLSEKEKDFDSYFFMEFKEEELNAMEYFFIRKYKPKYNSKFLFLCREHISKSKITNIKSCEYLKILEENRIPYEKFGKKIFIDKKNLEIVKCILKDIHNGKILKIVKEV